MELAEQHGLPDGGTWYSRQAPQMDLYAKAGGFLVSWDSAHGGASKVYGVYPSPEDFYSNLMEVAASKRYGYEVIGPNAPCRAYADVEWYAPNVEGNH